MGLFSIFKREVSDKQPKIHNERELKAFWLTATKDESLSQFLVEVTTHVGRYGYLMVERGGNGRPYSVEYYAHPEDSRRAAEVQAELRILQQEHGAAQTDADRDRLDRKIAELGGGVCTIRINVMTSDEFNRQKGLIVDAWARFKQITRNMK